MSKFRINPAVLHELLYRVLYPVLLTAAAARAAGAPHAAVDVSAMAQIERVPGPRSARGA